MYRMWPWGHAIAGYLLYTLLSFLYRRRPLSTPEALFVVIGTQIPDLIDKPLGWTLAILPSGRSLGHSLLTWTVVAIFVLLLARRIDRLDVASALLVGYLTGIVTDLPTTVLQGEFSKATFLLWPILSSPNYEVEPSILANLDRLRPADLLRLQLAFLGLVAGQVLISKLWWKYEKWTSRRVE